MADLDPKFYGNEDSNTLFNHLMTEARKLPVLVNQNSNEIRYLLHFSTDDEIQFFESRPLDYCWADVFSANVGIVAQITNSYRPTDYTSIYISSSPIVGHTVIGRPGDCIEYAIKRAVRIGEFGRVAITLDPTEKFFLP
ncbi:hypothetical protein [Pseudomonas hunanensis]|uniref:hypothetical protein n=1 Tax=Pseudomonas hunanensis TaxID=1247546 RepID=UPI0030DB660E